MNSTTKLQLYIISVALILALIIIGLFWTLNRKEPLQYTFNQTTPTIMTQSVTTDALADSIKNEHDTEAPVVHQGLTKLIDPTTMKALVLGDSIAESSGASNNDLSGWSNLVASDLHNKYPGTIQWQFKTSAEASIDDVLTFVPEAGQDTDLIVLCLGRYDVGKMRLTEFKQKYDQLIVELNVKSPNANLFLVVEPPVKDVAENNKFFPYRKIILDLGLKHQLPVIDQWTAFINDPTPLSGLLADGVNPNDQGYEVFAGEVLRKFGEFLEGVD